jgi:transposase-like protein
MFEFPTPVRDQRLWDRFNGLRNGGFLAHRNHQGVEMRQKSEHPESPSERLVKTIRRATRKRHSSEEKIRIVLDGLRGESSIAELCRREGIAESLYYAWSKEFLEAGKRRLAAIQRVRRPVARFKDLRREGAGTQGGRG